MIWDILWIGWAAAFFAIELPGVFNKHENDTFSEKLRDIFHTKTMVGRSIWCIVWMVFAGLFAAHIMGADLIFWS